MRSYRFARRSFIAAVGGAFGLKIMLRNIEAVAEGATPPPRFLMTHWPVGTIRTQWVPTGSGSTYTTSPILKPFEDAGLREDMIVLYGLTHSGINTGQGGGHEAGTPMMVTGANCPGTRRNGGEADDSVAGGPSWDQIFLKRIPELQRPGQGYANAICDSRIDSYETSTRCLSYSYTTRSIVGERPTAGGMLSEHVPLYPTLSPLSLYTALFQGFMPGGSMTDEAALRALRARKSVLDYALSELDQMRMLAPASERTKIEEHAAAIRKIEEQLSDQIMNPPTAENTCALPMKPDGSVTGKNADVLADYTNPTTSTDDSGTHRAVGKAHWGIIKAAFQCDLIRVATFQWSPGTNHVSFKGLDPNSPNTIYMHHPLSHKVQDTAFFNGDRPSSNAYVWDAMVSANKWYNTETAALIAELKTATDTYGGNLLDHTVIPHVTEVAEANHSRGPLPALIFGGKALGMKGGQFQNLSNKNHNCLWVSVAQAYLKTNDPLGNGSPLAEDTFVKTNVAPIAGLWAPVT